MPVREKENVLDLPMRSCFGEGMADTSLQITPSPLQEMAALGLDPLVSIPSVGKTAF